MGWSLWVTTCGRASVWRAGFGTSDLALTFDDLIALAQRRGSPVVSGDRHLLDVASSELQVLTPRELADRLGLASAG